MLCVCQANEKVNLIQNMSYSHVKLWSQTSWESPYSNSRFPQPQIEIFLAVHGHSHAEIAVAA